MSSDEQTQKKLECSTTAEKVENNTTDETITMVDVLQEEKELEEDANAVLGASDDKNCTYIQGYIKRQALYACSTCSSEAAAGICLACSYACHEGHDLVELYTKRNFRCDCGNSKFPSNPCKFFSNKSPLNSDNNYNQNFHGKYCTCLRPYPDPEDDIADEMIQCVLCEDWYHSRHLNCKVPENEDFGEMICAQCMNKNLFLWAYNMPIPGIKIEATDEKADVDCTENGTNSVKSEPCDKSVSPVDEQCALSAFDEGSVKKEGAAFWSDDWRTKLCKCSKCLKLYDDHKISFVLDPEDTVHSYEEQGKSSHKGATQYDRGMNALSRMDRIKQVEAIQGYNSMKTALKDYLQKFADNGKVVREEDIREFFTGMQSNKKMKTDAPPPHFCR